jgi:hypothetical protein
MALTITDPGHGAVRKGLRAAIAMPVTMALAMYVVDDTAGLLFAIFGTVGLLINADFAGSARQRAASYLLTGVAGSIALTIGWAASFNTVAAVMVTLVVAFALAFIGLVRGTIAVGTPAVLLVFVVAVSIDGTPTSLPAYLLGWWLAVVVSTISALLLFPHNRRADQRAALAAAFTAAARSAERTWLAPQGPSPSTADFAAYGEAVDRLDAEYGGQPFRTNGLTTKDQAMTLLIDHANSARLLLAEPDQLAVGNDAAPLPERSELTHAIVASLDGLASAMRDPQVLPSGRPLDDARVALTAGMEAWVLDETTRGAAPSSITERIGSDHRLRMVALVIEQMVELARLANGGDVESLERQPPIPTRRRTAILVSQLHPRSAWLRNSLRSALGLAVAVLVVNITGVDHGFWVLLGVISILRYDAVGTRRFALQAVVGTIIGVVLASVILVFVADQAWVLWVLLPPAVFLAAWSAAAVSYPVGQAAFSALILISLAIVEWPPRLSTGLVRIEDIALGAGVALVVGLLMWPRGAVGYLRRDLADATRTAGAYMSAALGSFAQPLPTGELDELRHRAVGAAERAAETYDIALMQRGPTEDLRPWTTATVTAYLVISAGRVVEHFAASAPTVRSHPALIHAIDAARLSADAHWTAVADAMHASDRPTTLPVDPPLPFPVLTPVTTTQDARDLIIAVWVVDWVRHLDRLSTGHPDAAPVLA